MKYVGLSLLAFSFYSVHAAQNVSLQAVSIEEQQQKDVPTLSSETTKISVQKLKTPISTIDETLKNQFYVTFQKSGDYSSEPYIRGRGNKGVPIYLEGLRLNGAHPDSTNLFNMIDAQEIDVYRGASGAALGMGAMSGGIMVKYKTPKFTNSNDFKNESFINTKASFLSTSGYTSTLGTTFYNQFINFSLSGGISDYDNYDDAKGDEVLHSKYDTSHYNVATAIKTGDDSYIYARFMKDKASSQDPFSRYQNAGVWFYRDRPNDEAKTYFIGYKKKEWYGFEDLDLQAFKSDIHYDMNTKKEATPPYATELFRESKTRGIKFSAKKELNENHLLSFSTSYSKMKITNGVRKWNGASNSWTPWMSAFGITEGEVKNFGLKLNDDFSYGKSFYTIGFNYESVKRDVNSNINTTALSSFVPAALLAQVQQIDTHKRDNLFSFNFKAGYEFSQAFIPYVKLSNSQRTPYFNEAFGNNPSNGSMVPNQTLENEKVWGIDVGADGKYNSFYYTSALYYQRYSDYIELVKTGYMTTAATPLPIKRYTNLDKAIIYGAELMGGYGLGDDLFAEASYLYTYGQNEDNDTPLAFIAPQRLTLSLSQKRQKGLSWRIEEVFVDHQNRVSSVNGEVKTPGYSLTNASVSYNFSKLGFLKDATFGLEINNIFDKEYREHLDTVSSTAWYLPDNPGINGVVSFKAKF